MKIITVTPELMDAFKDMIPESVLQGKVWVLAAVDGQEIVTVAVVRVNEPHLSLKWIYTDEVQQKKGGATFVISHLKKICDKHHFVLTASYDANEDVAFVLNDLILKNNGDISVVTHPEYTFTREELLALPIAKREKNTSGKIFKLSEVPEKTIGTFLQGTDEVNAFDIVDADQENSLAYVSEKAIGLLLLTEKIDDSTLGISTFYVNPKFSAVAPSFIAASIRSILSENTDIKTVWTQILDDHVEKILHTFVGDKEPSGKSDVIVAMYDAR